MLKNFYPFIGFSTGDPNGVGIEIILKSLSDNSLLKDFKAVVFSNYKLIDNQNKLFNTKCKIVKINEIKESQQGCINVINVNDDDFKQKFGYSNQQGGEFSRESLFNAAKYLSKKKIDALVTAPINKNNIQGQNFKFKGHTDFLDSNFIGDSLMFMVSDDIKVALLTEHVPIDDVVSQITPLLVKKRIKIVEDSLKKDFNIPNPNIAILSINPHVGDNGVIGKHDDEILIPTINEIKNSGFSVAGPFASDSFFGSNLYKKYDAIMACYHDQGLIPFKTLTFGKGVNFTAGLNIVRTSPDHGTAYDISGKNVANPSSFKSAILTALNILKNRSKI